MGVLRQIAPSMGTIWNRTIFNVQFNALREAVFNYFVVRNESIAAPAVYVSKVGAFTGDLILITEFIRNAEEYQEGTSVPLTPLRFDAAVQGLAAVHGKFWNDDTERTKWVSPSRTR